MGDTARQLELVVKPLDEFLIFGDLRSEDLEGDGLVDLQVEDFVNPAHPSFSQVFQHLIASCESRPDGELTERNSHSPGRGGNALGSGKERSSAAAAKGGDGRVFMLTPRTFHGVPFLCCFIDYQGDG